MSQGGARLISALIVLCYMMVPHRVARGSLDATLVSEVDPGLIVGDHKGNLWFTEDRGIERMTATGAFRLFKVPGLPGYYNQTVPGSLAVGMKGTIWFTSGARLAASIRPARSPCSIFRERPRMQGRSVPSCLDALITEAAGLVAPP